MSGPRSRRRVGFIALVAAGVGLVALIISATVDGLVYYLTPTEVAAAPHSESVLRIGGLVVEGSVVRDDSSSTLTLTDGATDVAVRYAGPLPDVVHEGEGAVVEGRWAADGVIEASEILLRHSNEYAPRPPEDAP